MFYGAVRLTIDAIAAGVMFRVDERRRQQIARQHIVDPAPKEAYMRLWQDVKYAARGMARAPFFSAIVIVTLALTIGAVNMGIFASAFARNELQVIQFIPLLVVPQILLGGLFFPVKTLPIILKQLAYVFPITYANFALKDVMLKGFGIGDVWPDLIFLVGFALAMVLLAAFTLRQERV